ncbi:chemokine-like protein TAFA-5 isoform X2 [Myripristis murdjan]|uniref:chemokine-like protein TAFA-5 isoform X2 n=1 Tax=Myripristis murdjan TaxID=586833 RepID=UPI001175D04F|nr:chemokine-like protein TAFA-5 isoform X2 [Myripristis murdjan]
MDPTQSFINEAPGLDLVWIWSGSGLDPVWIRSGAGLAAAANRSGPAVWTRPQVFSSAVVRSRQWCDMSPCLDDEGCDLLVNQSGWTCTQPGGRVKTTTVS